MQAYRVKVKDNTTANPEQVKDGYLSAFNRINIYESKSIAERKARLFNGVVESYGKYYSGIAELKMLQVAKKELSILLINELCGRQVFTDGDMGEKIYYGDVFETIRSEEIEKIENGKQANQDFLNELEVLSYFSMEYEYIMIV